MADQNDFSFFVRNKWGQWEGMTPPTNCRCIIVDTVNEEPKCPYDITTNYEAWWNWHQGKALEEAAKKAYRDAEAEKTHKAIEEKQFERQMEIEAATLKAQVALKKQTKQAAPYIVAGGGVSAAGSYDGAASMGDRNFGSSYAWYMTPGEAADQARRSKEKAKTDNRGQTIPVFGTPPFRPYGSYEFELLLSKMDPELTERMRSMQSSLFGSMGVPPSSCKGVDLGSIKESQAKETEKKEG